MNNILHFKLGMKIDFQFCS